MPHSLPPEVVELVARLDAAIPTLRDPTKATTLHTLISSLAERSFRHVIAVVGMVTAINTVTASAATDAESRLLTAEEAAARAGPSFTAKKLYRLRGSMPIQAWLRKGGRLYFREGPFMRWLAMR